MIFGRLSKLGTPPNSWFHWFPPINDPKSASLWGSPFVPPSIHPESGTCTLKLKHGNSPTTTFGAIHCHVEVHVPFDLLHPPWDKNDPVVKEIPFKPGKTHTSSYSSASGM